MRNKGRYERNKRERQKERLFRITVLGILVVLFIMVWEIYQIRDNIRQKEAREAKAIASVTKEPAPTLAPTPTPTVQPTSNPEEQVYTYLQGPKSWKSRIEWSGQWGDMYLDGGYFGAFGCGLCCMANVYSTAASKYESTPLEMYQYAKKQTYYAGGMAIEWGYMRQTLSSLGFDCSVKTKPGTYQEFADSVKKSESCIVLVSSNNSEVYWKDTPGHYVTIFLYDKEKETVLLADSGNPDHNRQRISLKKIYRSLKTSSNWQYLYVGKYEKRQDKWKHKKADGDWVTPGYCE